MRLVQKTVYFREDDIASWNAIENKAAWLHEHLNNMVKAVKDHGDKPYEFEADKDPAVLRSRKPSWCKEHDMAKDFCKLMKHKEHKA